ncbi:MAG: 3-oxoadipate enol-lactonase [Acidothermaceae bacterium]
MKADLHYVIDGVPDAPLVVLANSVGTTTAVWKQLLPALTERFRVLRFDHRGHGESSSPPAPWSMADLAGDVASLLDHLGVSQVRFVGLSLGGMEGIWLAAHRPDLVEKLAVICSSGYLGAPENWHARAATVRAAGMAAVVDKVVDHWFTPDFAAENPAVVDEFKAMLVAIPAPGYAACCDALADLDLRPELPSVKASTVVVSASDDLAIPTVHGKVIADAVPGARFVVVEHAAHIAVVEQPEQLARIIIDHFCDGEN